MPWLSDWKPEDPVQVMIYGQAKTGKTWGALTFPRPVVMDFDRGISTARNPEFVKRYGLRDIFYETFSETQLDKKTGVPIEATGFDEACRFFDEWMKPSGNWKGKATGASLFDTWIIDSGTTLSEYAMHKAVVVMGKMKLSETHEKGRLHGLIVPRIQDYGSERSLVEQFVDMVKSSGKHVVFICHEKEVTNSNGQTTGIVPLLTGKSAEAIPLKFDEVYNLRIVLKGPDRLRLLQTQPDGLKKVGSRYGIPDDSQWSWESVYGKLSEIKRLQQQQKKG